MSESELNTDSENSEYLETLKYKCELLNKRKIIVGELTEA